LRPILRYYPNMSGGTKENCKKNRHYGGPRIEHETLDKQRAWKEMVVTYFMYSLNISGGIVHLKV